MTTEFSLKLTTVVLELLGRFDQGEEHLSL